VNGVAGLLSCPALAALREAYDWSICFEFIDAGERSLICWNELRVGGCQAAVLSCESCLNGARVRGF